MLVRAPTVTHPTYLVILCLYLPLVSSELVQYGLYCISTIAALSVRTFARLQDHVTSNELYWLFLTEKLL